MPGPFDPQNYYETLTSIYSTLFGRNWHLGYWLNAASFGEAGDRLNEAMIRRLEVQPGQLVVDVGCGIGGPTCDVAAATGCRVIGVTNSPAGIMPATKVAAERGLASNVTFELGEASQLPLGDGSADALFSCEALHNVADHASLGREFRRVLKPGGRFVIGDLFLLRRPPAVTIDMALLRSFSFHLVVADDWIEMLGSNRLVVRESVNIGHHVGPQSLAHCISVCERRAHDAVPDSLEQTILLRTVEATRLLSQGFQSGDLGWGIWSGDSI